MPPTSEQNDATEVPKQRILFRRLVDVGHRLCRESVQLTTSQLFLRICSKVAVITDSATVATSQHHGRCNVIIIIIIIIAMCVCLTSWSAMLPADASYPPCRAKTCNIWRTSPRDSWSCEYSHRIVDSTRASQLNRKLHTVALLFTSTPPSRPNKVGLKCPSARPYVRTPVRPST